MLNQKKLDTKILNSLKATVETVTLPFTPTSDGILIASLRAGNAGRAYKGISGATPALLDGYQVKDGYFTAVAFCTRGTEVSQTSTSNVTQANYYFVALD